MNVRESSRFAWRGVTANKLRSALTTLGIMIGVAAVIVLVAVGTGSSQSVQDSISQLGSNTLTVSASGGGGGGRRRWWGAVSFFGGASAATDTGTDIRKAELTMDDAKALTDTATAPDVLGVAPVVSAQSVTATYEGASHAVSTFTGSTPAYLTSTTHRRHRTAFTDSDYEAHRRVVVVGSTVAKDLAGGDGTAIARPAGSSSTGCRSPSSGILTEKGSTGPLDQDDRVIAPATTVQDTLSGYGHAELDLSQGHLSRDDGSRRTEPGRIDPRRPTRNDGRRPRLQRVQLVLASWRQPRSSASTFTVLLARHRGDLTARGRHRRHEHHAGDGH